MEGIKVAAGILAFFGVVVLSDVIRRWHVRWRWAARCRKRRSADATPVMIDLSSPATALVPMPSDSILIGPSGLRFWIRTSQGRPVLVCMTALDRQSLGEAFHALIPREMPVAPERPDPAPGHLKVYKS